MKQGCSVRVCIRYLSCSHQEISWKQCISSETSQITIITYFFHLTLAVALKQPGESMCFCSIS